jgi:hypothetical protein
MEPEREKIRDRDTAGRKRPRPCHDKGVKFADTSERERYTQAPTSGYSASAL